jgi:hypothetical protein
MAAIVFDHASGRVEATTITATNADVPRHDECQGGIVAEGGGGETVDVVGVTITGTAEGSDGIAFGGRMTGTVTDSTVRHKGEAVFAGGGATVTVEGSTLEDVYYGAYAVRAGMLTVHDTTITGQSKDPDRRVGIGIEFFYENGGEVSGNDISNFSCGINVEPDGGPVTIGTNTYSTPPGNYNDVCDLRDRVHEAAAANGPAPGDYRDVGDVRP